MARTIQSTAPPRSMTRYKTKQMSEFEQKMRKYYPKNSRFFSHGSHYQPRCADNFMNPNSLVPQRYKRDFFRSFYADRLEEWEIRVPEPSKIPQNLRILKIYTGSEIVLRKLIKQNKKLEHLVLEARNGDVSTTVVKCLKYSKNLRSISFNHHLHDFSKRECQKMLKTWGNTLVTFKSLGFVWPPNNGKRFKRAMETILKFPKLKNLELKSLVNDAGKYFPFDKLQERNIAYKIPFEIGAFNSLMKKFPESKPAGNVIIPICSSREMSFEECKFQKKSNQTISLSLRIPGYNEKKSPLLPVFQNISSLDLTIPRYRCKYSLLCSSLGQLNNLKYISAEICFGDLKYPGAQISFGEENTFGGFFSYLNKNVAPYKKLETFLMKTNFQKVKAEYDVFEDINEEEEENEQNGDEIVHFFEAFSQSLKTVHLDFRYRDKKSEDDLEFFYQGLSKLEGIQSLNVLLHFAGFPSKKNVNRICKVLSEMKSLEELDFKLRQRDPQEKQLNIKLPSQLKKLSIGMDTSYAPFDPSKTFGPLTNLIHLELEFADFSSARWGKIFGNIISEIKGLGVLVLKQTNKIEYEDEDEEEDENENAISRMKEKLNDLMKESFNLKLLLFANMESKKVIILKRNYSWSEINPIMTALSFATDKECYEIKSYS